MPSHPEPPSNGNTLGERIIQAREALELSTAQLARRMAVSTSTLSGWENGKTEPRANRLVLLAAMTNVSLSWLLIGKGPGPAEYSIDTELEHMRSSLAHLQGQAQQMSEQLGELLERIEAISSEISDSSKPSTS